MAARDGSSSLASRVVGDALRGFVPLRGSGILEAYSREALSSAADHDGDTLLHAAVYHVARAIGHASCGDDSRYARFLGGGDWRRAHARGGPAARAPVACAADAVVQTALDNFLEVYAAADGPRLSVQSNVDGATPLMKAAALPGVMTQKRAGEAGGAGSNAVLAHMCRGIEETHQNAAAALEWELAQRVDADGWTALERYATEESAAFIRKKLGLRPPKKAASVTVRRAAA